MALAELLDDRFEIEHRISGGSMGEVFRGRDRVSGEPVAIKVLAGDREHHTARFAREIELLAELSHPGIVRYIAHGETPTGQLFLVMEWLDGENLQAHLQHEPLTMGEAVMLATRVALALGAAHARGIIHRDLKPSNLFLPGGRIDQVKILDFGIALKEGRTQLTRTGTTVGTPGYMAPEQARSEAIDARADVFALGCVLFECLTGTPAFEGDSAVVVLRKIVFDGAPRVRALWPEVPEDLDALVARMLAKAPALRPSDGADLAAALVALEPEAHTTAVAPRGRMAPLLALTGSERRLLSVVLLGGAANVDPSLERTLTRAIKPYGGRMEQRADGTTVVLLDADRQVATDQAARAARCALAMRAVAGDRPIAIAIGRVESTRELPGDDVIDRAFRMLAHVAPASRAPLPIALDEMSAGLLDARFDVTESDAGLMLHGERVLMQGARTLLGRPTSCVGRDWELSALRGILDECTEESQARAVIVTGTAGIGKSRLGAEFIGRVQQRSPEVAIWVGRGDSLRAGSTLDLLAQALRSALGIHGGEPLPERHDLIRARVAEHVPAAERKRIAEFLGELVGAPFPDDETGATSAALRAARQDAQLMSEQMRKAWLDFLDAETSAHPVLLVLEDLQWGDFGTARFIDAALRDRGARPWMVIALARLEVFELFPRLWADRHVQDIRLKELGRKASERLVRQVLGASVSAETIARLVNQADGNAFYLEELIRAAAEGKADALPETVLAMVQTRLDRLTVEARRVLRAASVFGEVCWKGGVSSLLDDAMGATMVGELLTRLVEQEVLAVRSDSRVPGEQELVFRHALLREGAYATLTDDDRRLGHHLAGKWLEQHGEGDPMVLASHFERGGETELAAGYYLLASRQAFHVLDLDATMARASLGLGCAPPPDLRIALLGMRCEASCQGLHLMSATIAADAEELMQLAPRGSIPWAQGAAAYFEGAMASVRIGELLEKIALLQEIDPAPGAVGKLALVFVAVIFALDNLGRVLEGGALEERFLTIIRPTWNREPIARTWWNITIAMRASYAHEDPWRALQHSDALQAIFDETGSEHAFLNMQLFRGMNLWYLGQLRSAEQTLENIAAADRSLGMVSSWRRFSLSWLRADRGALDAARALASELTEHGRAHGLPLDEGRGRWVLAEVHRRMGDFQAAERELEIALGMAVALEYPGVLGTLSALRLAQGRAAEALAAAEQAIARCTTMGGCGMFRGVLVRLAHAEALHATGAHDAARQAIAEARTRLVTIADRIPNPSYEQSFVENVPENARTLALAHAWLGAVSPST